MNAPRIEKAIGCLSEFVTDRRLQRHDEVLADRTRHITIALEDIYRSQNASAVVRSCECFGLQDLHVIENYCPFDFNADVMQGAGKWVDIYRYHEPGGDNTARCLAQLKGRGYRICATGLDARAVPLESLQVDAPVAILIGSEETGLSDAAFEFADEIVQIPMFGFTQSFNLSVSAALCLQSLCTRMRAGGSDWCLTEDEKQILRLKWLKKSVRNAPALLRKFGFEDMVEEF